MIVALLCCTACMRSIAVRAPSTPACLESCKAAGNDDAVVSCAQSCPDAVTTETECMPGETSCVATTQVDGLRTTVLVAGVAAAAVLVIVTIGLVGLVTSNGG